MEEDKKSVLNELESVAGGTIKSESDLGSYDVICDRCGTKMIPVPGAGKGEYICPNCDK